MPDRRHGPIAAVIKHFQDAVIAIGRLGGDDLAAIVEMAWDKNELFFFWSIIIFQAIYLSLSFCAALERLVLPLLQCNLQ